MRAIVTVKLANNPHHDPSHKVIDTCPISETIGQFHLCSDATGAHHCYLESGLNLQDIRRKAEAKFNHITRIEAYDEPEEAKE